MTKEKKPVLPSRLLNKTLFLLQNRLASLTLVQISKETGLSEGWLSMLNQGKISAPSVNNIETLYEYLAKTQLQI